VKAPASRRKRRSPADLLSRISAAAAEEFRRSGYAGATTAAIAKRADVTEAQLFRYFKSKAALYRETVFKPLDEQLQTRLAPLAGETDAKAAYIDELQRFIAEHAQMLTSLFVVQTYDPAALEGLSTISSLREYFERGAALMTARLDGEAKVAPKVMVRISFAAVVGCVILKDWLFPPGLADDDEVRAAINDFIREGLAANSVEGTPIAED
jgi:AcrR family transcriptional regulator